MNLNVEIDTSDLDVAIEEAAERVVENAVENAASELKDELSTELSDYIDNELSRVEGNMVSVEWLEDVFKPTIIDAAVDRVRQSLTEESYSSTIDRLLKRVAGLEANVKAISLESIRNNSTHNLNKIIKLERKMDGIEKLAAQYSQNMCMVESLRSCLNDLFHFNPPSSNG